MPKLSDTALIILSAAAKRDDGLVLPLPKSVKGGLKAATPTLRSLLKQKLLTEQPASSAAAWRESGDDRFGLAISKSGLKVIGVDATASSGPTAKSASVKKPRAKKHPAGSETKLDKLKAMLSRKDGMTVAEASEATGWLTHSVRGVMSGVFKKKLGLTIDSKKVEGRGRVYRIGQ
jgi:hypothetical protein